MKIKLSKSQWVAVGRKAGWVKVADQVYNDPKKPCPKCGNPDYYIANQSMPIINECTKCNHMWNPDNTKPQAMCDNCGGSSHHADECPYSLGANPQ